MLSIPKNQLISFNPSKSKCVPKSKITPGLEVVSTFHKLQYPFKGTIVKCLDRTAVIEITETMPLKLHNLPEDSNVAASLNQRVLVSFNEIFYDDKDSKSNHFDPVTDLIEQIKGQIDIIQASIDNDYAKIENLKTYNIGIQKNIDDFTVEYKKQLKIVNAANLNAKDLLKNWKKEDDAEIKQNAIIAKKQAGQIYKHLEELNFEKTENLNAMARIRNEIGEFKKSITKTQNKLDSITDKITA